jgi:hypothetical protein
MKRKIKNIFDLYFKHKISGYLLIEIMFALFLVSTLFLMLYRTYSSTFRSVNFLKRTNDLHVERMVAMYHMQNDIMCMVIPSDILNAYVAANSLKPKDKNNKGDDSQKVKLESSNKEKSSGEVKGNEKEEKKNKAILENYLKYLPKLLKNDSEVILSFYTNRSLLTNKQSRKFSKLTYRIVRTQSPSKDPIYKLMRMEEEDSGVKDDKKSGSEKREYALIEYIKNPSFKFMIPIYNKEKDKKDGMQQKNDGGMFSRSNPNVPKLNADKEDGKVDGKKEEESDLEKWHKDKKFEFVEMQDIKDAEQFLKKSTLPCFVVFEGDIVAFDDSKSLPFSFYYSVPSAEYAFALYMFYEKVLENQKNKNVNPEDNMKSESEENKKNSVVADESSNDVDKKVSLSGVGY